MIIRHFDHLDKSLHDRLNSLAPLEIMDMTYLPDTCGLMALKEGSAAEPTGLMVYASGKAEELYILWLYVVPEHRREGIATALIDQLKSMCSGRILLKLSSIYADEDDALDDFSYLGFEKTMLQTWEYHLRISDLIRSPIYFKEQYKLCCTLSNASMSEAEAFLRRCLRSGSYSYPDIDPTIYEEDLSCFSRQKNNITAGFLVLKLGSVIHPVALYASRDPEALYLTLNHFVHQVSALYPADTPIVINCYSQASRELIKKLLPQACRNNSCILALDQNTRE